MAKKKLAKHFPKLVRAILKSPCCNASAVELVFIKIAAIDSTPATFPPRSFSHNYIKVFTELLLKYLVWAPFLVKLCAMHHRVTGQKFTETLINHSLFSQVIQTASFGSIFRRVSLVKPASSKAAILTFYPFYFIKIMPITDAFSGIFETFRNS